MIPNYINRRLIDIPHNLFVPLELLQLQKVLPGSEIPYTNQLR